MLYAVIRRLLRRDTETWQLLGVAIAGIAIFYGAIFLLAAIGGMR